MVKIIEYNGDKAALVKLMEELQDYLIQMDPLKRMRRLPEYGEIYVDSLLKKIADNQGKIFVAEFENISVGMIAGIIEKFTKNDEVGYLPSKPARILELIVSEKYRCKNIGSLLMDKIEEYFQIQKCDIIHVEVFEPNKKTHNFYKKLGYNDRTIDMVKKIISNRLGL